MDLTQTLFALARRLMPSERGEWLDAMRAESHHLHGGDRLRWAFGCVVAALKQRVVPMKTGDFHVSRWVVLVETLGCFGALVLACGWVLVNSPGIFQLTPEFFEKHFRVDGHAMRAMFLWTILKTFIGPIGLVLGLRYVLTGRGITNRVLGLTLIGLLGVKALVGVVYSFFVMPDGFSTNIGEMILLTILPIVGLWHLMFLARPAAGAPPAAA